MVWYKRTANVQTSFFIAFAVAVGLLFILPHSVTAGLVDGQTAYFKFDEGAGNTTTNALNTSQFFHSFNDTNIASSLGYWTTNGLINNATFLNATTTVNKFWRANFTGTDIQLNDTTGGRSVSFWINQTNWGENVSRSFFSLDNSAFRVGFDSDTVGLTRIFLQPDASEDILYTNDTINLTVDNGEWVHIGVSWNGTIDNKSLFFAVNNVTYEVNGLFDDYTHSGASHPIIGEQSAFGFQGSIDELGLWTRALSKNEMGIIYNYQLNGIQYPYNNFTVNSQTFNNPVLEGSTQIISINITYDNNIYPTIIGVLNYNNTQYSAVDISGVGSNRVFNATLTTPVVSSQQNLTFNWTFTLSNSTDTITRSSSTQNQTIDDFIFDDCSVNTIVILNATARDEDSQALISTTASDNLSVEIDLDLNGLVTFNQTFSLVNSVAICISEPLVGTQKLNALIEYSSADRVTEFYNLQQQPISATSGAVNITLFDLAILSSQEFLITYKDKNFLPVPNVLIDIQRKYVGDGVFKTVEVPKTDTSGQAIGHFVLTDAIYTIVVKQNGTILSIFDNIQVFCSNIATGDCRLNLLETSATVPFDDFLNAGNVSYNFIYDDQTRLASLEFVNTDNVARTMNLNITQLFNSSVSLCDQSLTSIVGTVSCTLGSDFNGTAIARISADGTQIAQSIFSVENITDNIGSSSFILVILIPLTLALLGFTSGVLMLVFFGIGLVLVSVFAFLSFGAYVGAGSILLWFLVAIAILIWKISRREEGGVI